jgi:TonB family protein
MKILITIFLFYCLPEIYFSQNCTIDVFEDRSVISFSSEMPEGSVIEFFVYYKGNKRWEKIDNLTGDIGIIKSAHKTYVAIWNYKEYPDFNDIDNAKIRITDTHGAEEELYCKKVNKRTSDNPEKVFDYTEQKAEYPGGQLALYTELRNYIFYPESALQNQMEGTVYVSFIIEKSGYISGIRVERGLDRAPELSNIALLAVTKLKFQFKPATMNDEPVRSKMTIPIKFSINN